MSESRKPRTRVVLLGIGTVLVVLVAIYAALDRPKKAAAAVPAGPAPVRVESAVAK